MHLSSASQQMLVLICLVGFLCVFTSGVISHDPKRPACCKKLIAAEPPAKISKCYNFKKTDKCVESVGLIDKKQRMYCIDPEADWLEKKIKTLERRGVICQNVTKN